MSNVQYEVLPVRYWRVRVKQNEKNKDCKGVSNIFIVKFTHKYKQLFVEEYSSLMDAAARKFLHITKIELNLTE